MHVLDACERVEKAAKTIEEAANKLQNRQAASYAQAARTGGTRATHEIALDAPQRVHPKEEKRVIVKIPDKTEAQIIKQQSKEEIVARIQQSAGGKTVTGNMSDHSIYLRVSGVYIHEITQGLLPRR